MPMTLRDTQREIRKAAKKNDLKDAGASAALGGTVGAAAMPMRPIKARGKRGDEAKALWAQAEGTGGKAGTTHQMDIAPDKYVRLGQVKGRRLYNAAYTANSAHKAELPKDDPLHYDQSGKRYVATAYKDKKGRVTLRQQDGAHTAETRAMRGKSIPATIHMVEGDAPPEKSAVKAIYRHAASKVSGRRLGGNLNLTPKTIEDKARKYPDFADKINDAAHSRLGHQPGTEKTDLPWRSTKNMTTKQLRTKQAAYVGGGAAALVGANYLSEKFSGKGVGNEAIKAGKQGSDFTRKQVATVIDPNKSIRKNYVLVAKGLPKHLLTPEDGLVMRGGKEMNDVIGRADLPRLRRDLQASKYDGVTQRNAMDKRTWEGKAKIIGGRKNIVPGSSTMHPLSIGESHKINRKTAVRLNGEVTKRLVPISKGLPSAIRGKLNAGKGFGEGETRFTDPVANYMRSRADANFAGQMYKTKNLKVWGLRPTDRPDIVASGKAARRSSRKQLKEISAEKDRDRRINAAQTWVVRQKVSKASDNTERTAAAATGATAGALAMPVRDKIGKEPKKFALKYKDIPEGTHQMKMPSKDLQRIAAPGVREKRMPWRDKKTNLNYTTKMAAAIHRGEKVGDGNKPQVAIYDDAARVTGGQHRVHGNAWAGQTNQDVQVVRMKGYYGGTERGHKAIRSRLKRSVYPKMFIKANPKNTADLLDRASRIPDTDKRVQHAKSGATDTSRVAIHKPMTKGDLHRLKGKQAAYMAGGAGTVVAARELYRRNVG